MVLLGIHTGLKNDLHSSAAKLVYSTTLHLPAEFFQSSDSSTLHQVTYVTRPKEAMKQLQTTPTRHFYMTGLQYARLYSSCTMVLTRLLSTDTKHSPPT